MIMEKIDLHEIQRSILEKLGYRNSLRFSELQGKESSNKVSFHLNKLRDKDLIKKEDQKYSTTSKGKNYLAYLEYEQIRQPVIINHVFVFKDESVYLKKREDSLDPFPGAYRGPVLRNEKDESMKNSAEEAFEKEFGTESKEACIKGVMRNSINFAEGFTQHYMAFFTAIETSIDIDEDFHELDELDELNIIPGLEKIIREVKSTDSRFIGEWKITEKDSEGFKVESIEFE